MFEVDNQDHEDQRRELLTLLKATTVITTYPWIVIGCLLANVVAMIVVIKISHSFIERECIEFTCCQYCPAIWCVLRQLA